ncbi:hypothetical protein PF003_g24893 [Phytophthora fragariae]|nr:hypothetical protein PF003_g24893 [Phytophthora fragariae]
MTGKRGAARKIRDSSEGNARQQQEGNAPAERSVAAESSLTTRSLTVEAARQ